MLNLIEIEKEIEHLGGNGTTSSVKTVNNNTTSSSPLPKNEI